MSPPLLRNELARKEPSGITVRDQPLRLRWELPDLSSSDGHRLNVLFVASVRALDDRTEQKMLAETFMASAPVVTSEAVVDHFRSTLQAAARKAAAAHSAMEWIDGKPKSEMADALSQAAATLAFACGLEVLPPYQVELSSPSLQIQQMEQAERKLAEQRAAGQVEHFERASKLLTQFEQLRAASPSLTPGDLLKQMSASDQGQTLQALLMAGSKSNQATACWAVAGMKLVRIDLTDLKATPSVEAVTLSPSAFLTRIRCGEIEGEKVLVIGKDNGLVLLDPVDRRQQDYNAPVPPTPAGFGRPAIQGSRLWSWQSEAGLYCWDIDRPQSPSLMLRLEQVRPAGAVPPPVPGTIPSMSGAAQRSFVPANLTCLDESRLAFSVGHYVYTVDTSGQTNVTELDGQSDVLLLAPYRHSLIAVCRNGSVHLRDRVTLRAMGFQRRAGMLSTAAVLPWMDSIRLLLAERDGSLHCVGLEDSLVTQYVSSYTEIRGLAASTNLVAALSPDRYRLVFWNTWDGKQPAAQAVIAGQGQHKLTDLALI